MSERIEITLSDLKDKINKGWKKKPLAEHYGIPVSRMGEIVKNAGLRFRSFKGPQVVLVDDTNVENTTEEHLSSERDEEETTGQIQEGTIEISIEQQDVQEEITSDNW